MQSKKIFQLSRWLLASTLAGVFSTALAQPRPCSSLPLVEREFARAIGACRDAAPIVDARPDSSAAVDFPVSSVIGLGFDDARNQLGRFTIQRSYRASAEPGGIVLAQQPTPPTRLPAGAIVRLTLSDGTLRPPPRVPESQIDGVVNSQSVTPNSTVRAIGTEELRHGQLIAQASPDSAALAGVASARAATPREVPIHVQQHQVPNVIGMWHRDARRQLELFDVERRYRANDAPAGRVIDQIPKASARLSAGSEVLLIVSSGPAPAAKSGAGAAIAAPIMQTIELPNVVLRDYDEVASALAEFKVQRIEVRSAAPSGQIVSQEPASGRALPPGSVVTLHVSDGSLASAPVSSPVTSAPRAEAPPAATAATAPPTTDAQPEVAPPVVADATPVLTTGETSATAGSAAEPKSVTEPAANGTPREQLTLTLTLPSPIELAIGAAVLFALLIGWIALRRRPERRAFIETIDVEPEMPARIEFAPTHMDSNAATAAVAPAVVTVAEESTVPHVVAEPIPPRPLTPADFRFAARFEVGDVTVEFTGPLEPEQAANEQPSVHHA